MVSRTRRFWLWRRLGTVVLAAMLGLNPLLAAAYAAEVGRHAVLVVDANTGRVLYQRSADALRHPASLVKLMTLYLVFEQIEQGRLSFTSKVHFSAHAAAQPPSKLDVEEGGEIDLIDAIKALITKSANDVAVAVAERVAGSEGRFVEIMNRKARELGMTATVFRNASGLPDDEQVTTARDMITLALRLQDQFPKHYPLFATRTFTWGGDTHRNHNTLLFRYQGLDGMKTGYIRASGFNLVASVQRGKKRVVAAYFGGKTAASRNAAVRAQLDAALPKASAQRTRRPAAVVEARADAAPPPARPKETEVAAKAPAEGTSTVPRVEVMRVRPVRAAVEVPAADEAPPASIEDLLRRPEPVPAPVPARATSDEPSAASAPPPAAPDMRAPARASVPVGPFQVQIGAFQSQDEAERRLAWARQRAGAVLGTHVAHMSQVKRGDKVFFRARYGGFDARSTAAGVCGELKRLEIDCLVMKSD
jgi:D-alanyl-D-alanine carboxypeptidase